MELENYRKLPDSLNKIAERHINLIITKMMRKQKEKISYACNDFINVHYNMRWF